MGFSIYSATQRKAYDYIVYTSAQPQLYSNYYCLTIHLIVGSLATTLKLYITAASLRHYIKWGDIKMVYHHNINYNS